MKWISDLAQRHKDEHIWIAGSGPSLDDYADNFLDDKLSITLHLAHLKYPNATYRHANEYDRVSWFKENRPEYLQTNCIFAFPFYKRTEREVNALLDIDNPNYYWFILRPLMPSEDVPRLLLETQVGRNIVFTDYGSCLHDAMFAAVMMGVAKISIIGCEHKARNGMEHFSVGEEHNWYRAKSTPYDIKGIEMQQGTELLISACAKLGVEVDWHVT